MPQPPGRPRRNEARWTLHGFGELRLRDLYWRLHGLGRQLDAIQTERDSGIQAENAADATARLLACQKQFRVEWDYLCDQFMPLLERVLPEGMSEWIRVAERVATEQSPLDDDGSPSRDEGSNAGVELPEFRKFLYRVRALTYLYVLIERKLRMAFEKAPENEFVVQSHLAALLLGADLEFVRESGAGKKRLDLELQSLDCLVEIKFCNSASDVARIKSELLSYIYELQERCRELFCVIYDCGHINDPWGYEEALEKHGTPQTRVTVRVVKH